MSGRVAETIRVYRTVGRNRSLRRVLGAFFAFSAQEYGVWIAIVVFAYEQGGPTTAGVVAIAQLIPSAIVAPVGSVLGDRMRRDRALALGYAIQAVANAACAVALWTSPPLVVYGCAVVAACAVTLTRPVHHAILPELSETPEELTAANSMSSSVEGLGMLIGPIVAAVILAVGGAGTVLFAFALTSAVAAIAASRLRLVHVVLPDADPDAGDAGRPALIRDTLDGFRELRREPGAASLSILAASQFFVLGALDVFFALLAIDILGSGEQATGVLAAAVGIGGLFGAAATAALVGRQRLAGPIVAGLVVTGVALAAVAGATHLAVAVVLLAICGAGRSFFDVATRTLLQRTVRDDILARVFGMQEGLMMIVTAIGAAAVPLLVLAFGERWAFVATGAALPAFGLLLVGALRAADVRADVPDPSRVALLSTIDIFAPLAQPALEQLARRLTPLRVPEEAVVMAEGDVGDRFYVIVDGEAVIRKGGRDVARVGPGAYVGEIALLRDVPRTATVVAATPLELLGLERDEFLAAVSVTRRSSQTADATVRRRLAQLGGVVESEP